MPSSSLHEALVELFRHRPVLAAELLVDSLAVPLPAWTEARLASADLTDPAPTEYRADAVVTLTAADVPVLAVVVEVQVGRDPVKRWSWPVYLATLRARLRCPVALLVVCAETATARWCATPIEMGHPGWLLRPLVVAPDQVPVVTDVEQAAQSPELAVLSALAHGGHADQEQIFQAMLSGLRSLDQDHANLYADVVLAGLPETARRSLEAMMNLATYEYQSDYARRYVSQGEADALLTVLAARGIEVPADARDKITGCTDVDQLRTWLRRAVTATSLAELFAE